MDLKTMCNKIRGKRSELRITQKEMALRLGISERAYNFKENNKVNFTVEEVITIANILQCNINDFFSKDM